MIPVADCQDFNDSEQHYITFQQGHQKWNDHSERIEHETSFTGKDCPNSIGELITRGDQ